MLFTTWNFWIFFAVVLLLFYTIPLRFRRYLLLVASFYFYMSWNARFVILLLTLITIDYFAAGWMDRYSGFSRRVALIVSLAANLGFLAWFKYTNFLLATWTQIAHPGASPTVLDIVLPLGISFHTFQSISYVVDVYAGRQKVIKSYIDYALFVAFFPQLVAGPIVRAKEFFADHWNWHPPSTEDIQSGVLLITTGLAKKLVCADRFALISDKYFTNPMTQPGLLTAWTGAIAFALQIFFDFSGYTDIAIGTARLMGYHFPENFRRPYLAAGITDFWRRWHISLSSWLRDYLYIPLGGNRHGAWKTYRNLLLTMLLGGLWHGASWNFVIWGGYHGTLLSIERMIFGKQQPTGWMKPPLMVLTFLLACIGWVFFRATTSDAAIYVIGQMKSSFPGHSLLNSADWKLVLLTLAIALVKEYGSPKIKFFQYAWPRAVAVATLLLAIELFGVTDQNIPFVYFQF